MIDFFVCEKIILKERIVSVMNIIEQEIQFEGSLKQRLKVTCEFSKVNPPFIKSRIRKIKKTNLSYIEAHKVIIKNINMLVMIYITTVFLKAIIIKLLMVL